jgi:glycogen operon protein
MAQRLVGSPDIYAARGPTASINFITCHDGFTLADLVSYNQKHNEANGERNRDGIDENNSWNCGAEGETDDTAIRKLRRKQMKNALTMLLLSQGVPMITMGDECGRTQMGNNNAYCHDSPLTWLDRSLLHENEDLLRFCRELIAFRRNHVALRQPAYPGYRTRGGDLLEVSWHGTKAWQPDWAPHSCSVAIMLRGVMNHHEDVLYAAFNMYWEPLEHQVPEPPNGRRWHLAVNTAAPPPNDIFELGNERLLTNQRSLLVAERSAVVLVA